MSFRDPRPDPAIARALRRVGADDVHSARERAALRRRILEHAEPLLSRRRRQQGAWWEYALAWRRTLVPIALSAAAVAMFSMLRPVTSAVPSRVIASDRARARPELLDAVANRMSSGDLLDLIVTGSSDDASRGRPTDTIAPKGSTQ
jgi:hypothetical protein